MRVSARDAPPFVRSRVWKQRIVGILTPVATAAMTFVSLHPSPLLRASSSTQQATDQPTPDDKPQLTIPTAIPAAAGGLVQVPLTLAANGRDISSAVFSLDYDERYLSLNAGDADQDGIPDAVSIRLPVGFVASISLNTEDTDGELDVVVFDPAPPLASLASGTLLTMTLGVGRPKRDVVAELHFSSNPAPSLGGSDGRSIPVTLQDGSVAISVATPAVPPTPSEPGPSATITTAPASDTPSPEPQFTQGPSVSPSPETSPSPGGPTPGLSATLETTETYTPPGSTETPTATPSPTPHDAPTDDPSSAARLFLPRLVALRPSTGLSSGLLLAPQGGNLQAALLSAAAAPQSQAQPSLTIGPAPEQPGVCMGLTLDRAGLPLATLVLSLDLQRLSLATEDGDGDGLPDAVRTSLPRGVNAIVSFDAQDHDGELDILITSLTAPLVPLKDGTLLTLTCAPRGGPLDAKAIRFASQPSPSFGDTSGRSVPGQSLNRFPEPRTDTSSAPAPSGAALATSPATSPGARPNALGSPGSPGLASNDRFTSPEPSSPTSSLQPSQPTAAAAGAAAPVVNTVSPVRLPNSDALTAQPRDPTATPQLTLDLSASDTNLATPLAQQIAAATAGTAATADPTGRDPGRAQPRRTTIVLSLVALAVLLGYGLRRLRSL